MYVKDVGLPLPRARSRTITGAILVPHGVHRLASQVLFLSPLFWFMELVQNKLYLLVNGAYGWGYELDALGMPTTWYSLRSLPLWLVTVIAFSLLDLVFEGKRTPSLLRFLIAGTIGWVGEWTSGFLAVHVMHRALQVWPGSSLVYVSFSALPLWWIDFVVFQWLTRELRDAHAHRSALL